MSNLHPVMAQALAPWIGYSNNPVADAAKHFDELADTFTTTVEYLGIEFDVEVNKHSLRCQDIIGPGGEDWFYEFSETARNNIARLAIHQEGV